MDTALQAVEPEALGAHAGIDALEEAMLAAARGDYLAVTELPVIHRFTPNLYVRQIFMPAGTLLTSKIHRTEHPYVVTKGRVSVFVPGQGVEHIEAPHIGITGAGTRRVLLIREDCTWLTFHPLTATEEAMRATGASEADLLATIEERIIERHEREDGRTTFDHYRALLATTRAPGSLEEELDLLPEQTEYMGAP